MNSLAARHKIFKRYASVVKRADSVTVYVIEAYPVALKDQNSTKKYIHEYPVARTLELPMGKIKLIQKAFIQEKNFVTDAVKRCPFQGEFAVVFIKKNRTVTVITSSANCSKALVYLPGELSSIPFDLKEVNSIELVLPPQEIEHL